MSSNLWFITMIRSLSVQDISIEILGFVNKLSLSFFYGKSVNFVIFIYNEKYFWHMQFVLFSLQLFVILLI